MNDKNLETLEKQIFNAGFGKELFEELKKNMIKGDKEFTLPHQVKYAVQQGWHDVKSALAFKKWDKQNTDIYFFNSWRTTIDLFPLEGITLTEAQKNELLKNVVRSQTFIREENGITRKASYNVMNGGAFATEYLNEKNEKVPGFGMLDYKNPDQFGNYPIKYYPAYDVAEKLEKHPILELQTPRFKENLIDSLNRGNTQSISMMDDGKVVKAFVALNPRSPDGLDFYDENRVKLNTKVDLNQGKEQGENNSKEIKENNKTKQTNSKKHSIA